MRVLCRLLFVVGIPSHYRSIFVATVVEVNYFFFSTIEGTILCAKSALDVVDFYVTL